MHVDDYLDSPLANPIAKKYLERARAPAHGMLSTEPYPALYADYRGTRVRVTMASRLGNVGITTNLVAADGYDARVDIEDLTNFSETP